MAEDLYSYFQYYLMGGKAFNPVSVVLLLTYRCNLRCKMCFYYNESEKNNTSKLISDRKDEELTREQIYNLIDQMAKMKVKVLTLHGGEPLVYEGLFEVSAYAKSKGILVNFITNGVLLNENNINRIIETGINSITISIDGPEDIHEYVRGMKGAYKKIFEGIALLKKKEKEGKVIPKIAVSTYISAMNQDRVHELFDSLSEAGIRDWGVGLVTYNSEKLSYKTKQILDIKDGEGQGNLDALSDEITDLNPINLLKIRDKIKTMNSSGVMQIFFPSENAVNKYADPFFNEVNHCLYPWARVVISPYGEVFPCISLSMINARMGNIKEKALAEIWNGKEYVNFRKKLKKFGLFPICSKCCTINGIKPL